jgi:hypothetical protein
MEGHMQRIFGIVFVFGLVLSQSIGLQSLRDIQFDDETNYLYAGIRMCSASEPFRTFSSVFAIDVAP